MLTIIAPITTVISPNRLKVLLPALLLTLVLGLPAAQAGPPPVLTLSNYAEGFTAPTAIAHAGDERLFIVEQAGVIRIINGDGSIVDTPFLDISDRVSSGGERGLLGLAFHPDYAQNGHFFVNYTYRPTESTLRTRIARFTVQTDTPNQADPISELTILEIDQPYDNHNGGQLKFGPQDGQLYIGLGDGGSANDPGNYAQNPDSLLGKMLRLDVDNSSQAEPYTIPVDNPFVADPNTRDEIWALGLRNPWRFTFDRQTGDLFIADVGQNAWEEVNFQPAASSGGENYGWRCYEGNAEAVATNCGPLASFTAPIHTYSHIEGISVTGGYVYRGSAYPYLQGTYLFADYGNGAIWGLQPYLDGWKNSDIGRLPLGARPRSFGENQAGELFIAASNGVIYRVAETTVTTIFLPLLLR